MVTTDEAGTAFSWQVIYVCRNQKHADFIQRIRVETFYLSARWGFFFTYCFQEMKAEGVRLALELIRLRLGHEPGSGTWE